MTAANRSSKKTMDVTSPGQSTPDTSGRPVVITHRPLVQDPMVKQDIQANGDSPTTTGGAAMSKATKHQSKTLEPISNREEPEETQQEDELNDNTDDNKTAIVDAVVAQAESGKVKKDITSVDAEAAKQQALQKQISEKKYFLPIGQVARRRNQRANIILLLFLVVLVGAYLAVDAGLIKSSITLPIDLIKQ